MRRRRSSALRFWPLIPEIAGALDAVFRSLTLERLQRLNAKIAVEGEDAHAVAAGYLAAQGLTP